METTIIETPVMSVTKRLLLDAPIPPTTRTYKTISHGQLMNLTLESLDTCGFKLSKELYSASNDGMRANGKYHLEYGNDNDMGLMIAWQNSYDKKISLKFAVGSHVFICENGMVVGDMGTFKSKHVGQIQELTPTGLKEAICRAGDTFEHMIVQKERMKEIEVSKRVQAELLGRMFLEDAILTSTQLNIIKDQLKKPEFDYGSAGSVWELYNHVTYSLRHDNPTTWMQRQMDAHKFYVDEFEIV